MRMFIATPSARDAERFGAVHDAAWRQHYADLFAPDYLAANTAAQRAQALLDRLNDPDWAARWALDQGAPAGILLLHRQGRSAQIDSLYLLAEHRGRGLGRRLVEAAGGGGAGPGPGLGLCLPDPVGTAGQSFRPGLLPPLRLLPHRPNAHDSARSAGVPNRLPYAPVTPNKTRRTPWPGFGAFCYPPSRIEALGASGRCVSATAGNGAAGEKNGRPKPPA